MNLEYTERKEQIVIEAEGGDADEDIEEFVVTIFLVSRKLSG